MSKVIKSGPLFVQRVQLSDLRPPPPVLQEVHVLQDAEDDARRTLDLAIQEATIIVRTARSEVQQIIDEAYTAGYNSGLRKGAEEAAVLIARLEEDANRVAADWVDLVDSAEPEVLKLCLEAVEKVIRHEIKIDPRVVVRTIKSCLRRIKDRSHIDVRVSPEEVAFVREQRDELLSVAEGTRAINIMDDRRVSPGGCVVESASGTLDAKIETQFDQISKKMMEIYENGRRQIHTGSDEIH